MENEILNTKEVSKLLKSDIRTIQRNAEFGKYPKGVCGKHGRHWLFNKVKLMEYIFNYERI